MRLGIDKKYVVDRRQVALVGQQEQRVSIGLQHIWKSTVRYSYQQRWPPCTKLWLSDRHSPRQLSLSFELAE